MTEIMDDGQRALQIEVQRMLGRCMLRLQQYERLLKAILQICHVTAKPDAASGHLEVQQSDVTRKTLGQLVGAFVDGHLVEQGTGEPDAAPVKDDADFSVHLRLEMASEEFDQTKQDLAELVTLRNGLVHHFIEQHDIATVAGYQRALDALQAADERVGACLLHLQALATTFGQVRQEAARALASDPVHQMLADFHAAEDIPSDQGPELNQGESAAQGRKASAVPRRH